MCVALVSVCADVGSVRVCVSVPRGCVFVIVCVCVYMCMMHVYAPPPLPPGGWGPGGACLALPWQLISSTQGQWVWFWL